MVRYLCPNCGANHVAPRPEKCPRCGGDFTFEITRVMETNKPTTETVFKRPQLLEDEYCEN